MEKKKKSLLVVVVIIALVLFGRLGISDAIDLLQSNSVTENVSIQDSEDIQQIEVVSDENNITNQDNALVYDESDSSYNGPKLPDLDYSKMSLFEDGYEIVELDFAADGDTANFIVGGQVEKTRMLAVDTPEKDEKLREVQPWGKYASKYTKQSLENADEIILELDADSDAHDKYGRLLAWVWVDRQLYNYILIDESLARTAYLYGDYKYTDILLDLEDKRKSQGKKIWGEKDPDFDY